MKLNFILCVLAVPTLGQIVTGTLGCGNVFRLRTFRGRTLAIPLDPECAVGPASDLGRIRNPYQVGSEIRRWRQNWSRWMAFTDRRYTSHWKEQNSTSETQNTKTVLKFLSFVHFLSYSKLSSALNSSRAYPSMYSNFYRKIFKKRIKKNKKMRFQLICRWSSEVTPLKSVYWNSVGLGRIV